MFAQQLKCLYKKTCIQKLEFLDNLNLCRKIVVLIFKHDLSKNHNLCTNSYDVCIKIMTFSISLNVSPLSTQNIIVIFGIVVIILPCTPHPNPQLPQPKTKSNIVFVWQKILMRWPQQIKLSLLLLRTNNQNVDCLDKKSKY